MKKTKIKFNKNAERIASSDLYYDLFNGYFDELIGNSDKSKEIKQAIKLLEDFLDTAEEKQLLELY